MSASKFNPDARTPEELLANCRYAVSQLDRWVEMFETMPEDAGVADAVQIAAEHLSSQSTLMVIQVRRVALGRAAERAAAAWIARLNEPAGGPPALQVEAAC